MDVPDVAPLDTKAQAKLYNANKARLSYEKNKEKIAQRRLLKRIQNGAKLNDDTINELHELGLPKRQVNKIKRDQKTLRKDVHKVASPSQTYIQEHQDHVKAVTNDALQFMEIDRTSEGYMLTKEQCKDHVLTSEMCGEMLSFFMTPARLLMDKSLMESRSESQKQIMRKSYLSKIDTIMAVYGTRNLLDVYINIEDLNNRLLSSERIALHSVKGYFSILVTLYKHAAKRSDYPNHLIDMKNLIHIDQMKKLTELTKSGNVHSKQVEEDRVYSDECYRWDDFKAVCKYVIKRHGDTVQGLRDAVILQFYIHEQVLRDNLGNVKIIHAPPSNEELSLHNMFDINHGVFYLNKYKTLKKYESRKIYVFEDTLALIRKYHDVMTTRNGAAPTYLISKDDGTMYKNGLLSGYIASIMNTYTGADDVSINSIRHSFATFTKHMMENHFFESYIATSLLLHTVKQNKMYHRQHANYKSFPNTFKADSSTRDPYLGQRCLYHRLDENHVGARVMLIGHITNKSTDDPPVYTIVYKDPVYKHIVDYVKLPSDPIHII